MLEYLTLLSLPLIDSTALRYQWRKDFSDYPLRVYGRKLYYNGHRVKEWAFIDSLAIGRRGSSWCAQVLLVDGTQLIYNKYITDPLPAMRDNYYELPEFLEVVGESKKYYRPSI